MGLAVNGLCLLVLGGHVRLGEGHGHGHGERDHDAHGHGHDDGHGEHSHAHGDSRRQDHSLWSAYLHVLADALTSVLAIIALLGAKYFGQVWLDPFMGVVGATLIVRWSWNLLGASARVLLDLQAPAEILDGMRQAIEAEGDNRLSDLLPHELPLAHVTVEVHRCPSPDVQLASGA